MTSRPTPIRLAMIGAVALPLAVSLAACGSAAKPAAPAKHATKAKAPAAAATSGGQVPAYAATANARKMVTAGICRPAGAKGWQLAGTVTNTAKAARRYTIVVDFVTVKGDTVLFTRVVRVPAVSPGATVRWRAVGAAGHTNVNCVVREALQHR
jgi:hypothetical protein